MAEPNSRIPKVPFRSCLKRPSENSAPVFDKRQKLTAVRNTQKPCPVSKVATGGFSEASKKAMMQPPKKLSNITNMRESMPITGLSSLSGVAPTGMKRKRPAWDLKGRVQDMEQVNGSLKHEILSCTQRLAALEQEKNKLHQDVEVKSAISEEAIAKVDNLQKELIDTQTKLSIAVDENKANQELIKTLKANLEQCRTDLITAQQLVTSIALESQSLQSQLEAMKVLLSASESRCKAIEDLRKTAEDLNNEYRMKIEQLEQKSREGETERRKLHNIIQELKGNIRVFCRIRPPLADELAQGWQLAHIEQKDKKTIELFRVNDTDGSNKNRASYEFTFDDVFCHSSSQDDIFHEISQLIQSALDGYNVCIFAYGQTGSGKTYTMEGPEDISDFVLSSEDDRLGMIPRSVQKIFQTSADLKTKGWKYSMETSFMEIYNENIRDLLSDNSQTSAKCEIKKTAYKGSENYISNVKTVEVNSASEVFILLRRARHNRSVAATHCNEHSSRSHYVFQMKINGENDITGEKCEGILNLVDLAGSERIKESGSQGERLTEAKNINKSLSNLGNVIMALCQKADHIPYRNSKLTHLLMNSLGGNSKTLMFVNISPWEDNFNETVNSLRFATKVNQCHIGTAQKKIKQ